MRCVHAVTLRAAHTPLTSTCATSCWLSTSCGSGAAGSRHAPGTPWLSGAPCSCRWRSLSRRRQARRLGRRRAAAPGGRRPCCGTSCPSPAPARARRAAAPAPRPCAGAPAAARPPRVRSRMHLLTPSPANACTITRRPEVGRCAQGSQCRNNRTLYITSACKKCDAGRAAWRPRDSARLPTCAL